MENYVQIKRVQQADFRFTADFGNAAIPKLITDEPSPLDGGQGPNPEQLPGAAVANCLATSLLFAMQKIQERCVAIASGGDDEPGAQSAEPHAHRLDRS